MERHRALLRPKFDAMTTTFSEILGGSAGRVLDRAARGLFHQPL